MKHKSNPHLLKNSIESLKLMREEMHDVMDSSKRAKLDKIISDLEQHGTEKSCSQLLEIIGAAIKLIPAVEALLRMWS
ncbi:hypothetical protein [Vibrio gazogenes]|uniref:Uncharacterized protein n=1 Tax=Vibrio gazogenes DSM 21264 = NBRC 103151 TaxID=1123492 RepID=A0A1M4XZ56_VIBGA|nr:hypothetical protein [Vibrio gazogenes]USP12835.1 hypothetical protein MKS89_10335 [Vibrio gazogenes]SHE98626.1 hypothetical protein SAMN02745781_01221 [Vibrio gazogenes DSM 21264] [Vibrio gazogenes DSM 21264 = NBRC 103151]SJN58815.1 hypothetical protein BQ6471_03199 [Vibrio gazogenes]